MIGETAAGRPERSLRAAPALAPGLEGEVDHHDRVLLDDAISRMMPIAAMIVNSTSNNLNAISAPTLAGGRVERIVNGWM